MSDQVFRLPDLGEGLTEAEVVRWLVAEGDIVEVDQAVVEVETAKSLVEVPTPYAGRVATRHAGEGSTLEVGKPLLTVVTLVSEAETYREEEQAGSGNVLIGYGTSGGVVTSRRRRPRVHAAQPASPQPGRSQPTLPGPAASSPPASLPAARPPLVVSPLVRKLARDGGVDLRAVDATGPGGLIVRSDVERALARGAVATHPLTRVAPPAAPAAQPGDSPGGQPGERRTKISGFRRAVSETLSRSRAEIPEATVWVDVDATPLWELRASAPDGPGLLAYIARFVVAALRQYPVFNARVDTERQEIVEFDRVNLGLAVQGDRGLVVPAVIGADAMTTADLDREIRRLTASAREGHATAQELAAGTFTLNNYGGFRVDGSAAIINHPQVAILGFGRILDRPWVVGGELCVRKITQMSFVFDHRVCDGGTAAGFMRSVADAVEDPASAIARL
jgi:2-oxoisovalerate dehydrogenase E2 component (dihydrolipoyl transacylase)